MNVSIVRYVVARLLQIEAALMIFPLAVSLLYRESWNYLFSFLSVMIFLAVLGQLLSLKKPENKRMTAREGFVIVAISWILFSFSAVCLLSLIRISLLLWMHFSRRAADSQQQVRVFWMMWNPYPIPAYSGEVLPTWSEEWGFWFLPWRSCRKSIPNPLIS